MRTRAAMPRHSRYSYDRWRDRLFGYLARAFDPTTAEELFQTLWMRIHGARGGYDRARTVAPWLFAIAANLRRQEWRRRSRRPEEPRPDVMPVGNHRLGGGLGACR